MIGKEARAQLLDVEGRCPTRRRASAAARTRSFAGFIEDPRLIGVEAAGAASLATGRPGLHGARSSVLADEDGQVLDAHSISAGLDYPGVGPEHAFLRDTGRAEYVRVTDDEALDAFRRLAHTEGIIPALEPAHALAHAAELDEELVLVCLSAAETRTSPRFSSSKATLVVYLMCGARRRSSPQPQSMRAPTSSSSASPSPTRSRTAR